MKTGRLDVEIETLKRTQDNLKELEATIKVLLEIRKQYEKKFGIRMFANGQFEEIREETYVSFFFGACYEIPLRKA